MSKKTFTFIIILLIALIAGAAYFVFYEQQPARSGEVVDSDDQSGFSPFPRTNTRPTTGVTGTSTIPATSTTPVVTQPKIPVLRQIYATPVGGMGATTTASSTLLRFIDRGTGHVYESSSDSLEVRKLSNTLLSRVYESYWNRNTNALVLRYMTPGTERVTSFYAELNQIAPVGSSTETTTQYELRGRYLTPEIVNIAISPKKDKIFEFVSANNAGAGYIATLNEQSKIQIFDTPLTQVNIQWPEENTLTITTKGSATTPGYLYFFDIKKAAMKRILGGIRGLSTLTNNDATKVLYTKTEGGTIRSMLYNTKDGSSQDVVFRTMPEKCVWSTLYKEHLYCAVPNSIPSDNANYPDAWYQGKVSFNDTIWQIDTNSGEVHQLADLISDSKVLIDAVSLTLDSKDNFLYFINKKDLSLWSLDLTQ